MLFLVSYIYNDIEYISELQPLKQFQLFLHLLGSWKRAIDYVIGQNGKPWIYKQVMLTKQDGTITLFLMSCWHVWSNNFPKADSRSFPASVSHTIGVDL